MRVALVSRDGETRSALSRAFVGAPSGWLITMHESVPNEADIVVVGGDHPNVEGTVRFDPVRPQLAVEEVSARGDAVVLPKRVYVVTGAGGGVGCSTVSITIARLLGAAHHCCLLDLDDRFGIATRLGLPGDHATWLSGGAPIPFAGLHVLASPATQDDPPDTLLPSLVEAYERVVVDVPVSRLGLAMDFATASAMVLAPSRPSAARSRVVIDRYPDASWAMVTNRTGRGGELTGGDLSRIVGRRIAVALPHTPRLRDAEDDLRFPTPTAFCLWTSKVRRLVRALERV